MNLVHITMNSMDASTFKDGIRKTLSELNELIPEVVEDVLKSDINARIDNKPWHKRHRLGVLIESSNKAITKIDQKILYYPWFIAELRGYVDYIKRWKKREDWVQIESSLKDNNHFTHTMLKLVLAEHFIKNMSCEVKIVPRDKIKSPDLMINMSSDEEPSWLFVECYQPYPLSGIEEKITETQLLQVEKRLMNKAKKQFKKHYPGIMALCSYYVKSSQLDIIKNQIKSRLTNTNRPYLGGVIFLNYYVEITQTFPNNLMTSKYELDLINNPSYFGKINLLENTEPSEPKINRTLQLLSKQSLERKTIFTEKGNRTPPYCEGKGNLNLQCGKCSTLLAENIWDLSLSNIVLHCTNCDSYNLCPRKDDYSLESLVDRVAILEGVYSIEDILRLKRGIMTIGVTKTDERINSKIRQKI